MARLRTSHFLSVLPSSSSPVQSQNKKRFWPRTVLAAVVIALVFFVFRFHPPVPPPEVPAPSQLDKLEPQLRDYLAEKIKWTREEPRDFHRQATLGMVYAANSLWREAQRAFRNAAKLNPREPLAALYVAISTQEMGEYEEALGEFRQLTLRFPDFPQGFYRLGEAALRGGLLDEAEPAFQRLMALAPREWRGYAGLGDVNLRKGNFPDATALLEKAVELDPEAKVAHHLLGQAYRGLGRIEDARLHLALGVSQTRNFMEDDWSQTVSQHAKLVQDQMEIASEYSAAGQSAKAEEILSQALPYQPENLTLINALAIVYNRSGRPDKARAVLLNVLQKDARYLPALVTLSHSCADLGLNDDALNYANRAIELGPSVVQTYLAKANALLAAGRDSEALEALEAANRCDPQNAEIQVELGDVCLLNLRRTKDALAHYETALKLNPVLVPVYVRLADLHMHLGRSKDAQTDLETLRKISPRMPDLVALEARLRKLANP